MFTAMGNIQPIVILLKSRSTDILFYTISRYKTFHTLKYQHINVFWILDVFWDGPSWTNHFSGAEVRD